MKDHLRKMLDAVVAGDSEAAQASFHDYVVDKSKNVFEMGSPIVKATSGECKEPVGGDGKKDPKSAQGKKDHKTTAKDEIKAGGESADDPKGAKTSSEVTSTMSKASKEDIKKNGESAADPTKAKGSKEVKDTVKKAAEPDITNKKS